MTWQLQGAQRLKTRITPLLVERILEARLREAGDGLLGVVHAHANAGPVKLVDLPLLLVAAVLRGEGHGQLPLARDDHVCRSVLVPKRMPAGAGMLVGVRHRSVHARCSTGMPVQRLQGNGQAQEQARARAGTFVMHGAGSL